MNLETLEEVTEIIEEIDKWIFWYWYIVIFLMTFNFLNLCTEYQRQERNTTSGYINRNCNSYN